MIRIDVKGIDDIDREFDSAGDLFLSGVRDLMPELAGDTAKLARSKAARGSLSGKLSGSIVARGDDLSAGSGVPYYGFGDFGGRVGIRKSVKRPFIKGGRYLFPALKDVGVMKKAHKMVDNATKRLK